MPAQRAVGRCETERSCETNTFRELTAENTLCVRYVRVRPLARRGMLVPYEAAFARMQRIEVVSRDKYIPSSVIRGGRAFLSLRSQKKEMDSPKKRKEGCYDNQNFTSRCFRRHHRSHW